MNDPYKILEVSPDATDEDIKKAYKRLARKYHPDNYANNPLASLAEEKMKEINEAYDTVMSMRSGKSSGRSSDSFTADFPRIRTLINQRRYAEAEAFLEGFGNESRNAEWYFLRGLTYAGKGYIIEARSALERAVYLDPDNYEYQNALNRMRSASDMRSRTYGSASDTDAACRVCQGLMCADCCCECLGGDLIRCC